jgi:hypothetical protein
MKWPPLEEDNKKAAANLGSDKDIPDEKEDLGKMSNQVTEAYDAMYDAARVLDAKYDNLLNKLKEWTAALKKTSQIFETNDFGLDKKADKQKIAKVRNVFETISNTAKVYDDSIKEQTTAQTQYRAVVKKWL